MLRPEHFYVPVHAEIFAAMVRHITAGRLTDHILLRTEFEQNEALRELDGAKYLGAIARAAESVVNAGDYGREIHDLALRRGIIAVSDEMANKAYDGALPESAADQIAAARQRFDALAREAPAAKLQMICWGELAGRQAPPRQFILPDWIPARCVTLLHGFGGVGKTLLAQQIGTACILRCQFLGGIADACPVLAWFGEDDHDEIWRRQESINAALGVEKIADLDGKLHWWPCPHEDITLFTAANESDFRTTPLFDALREQIMDVGVKLAILDSATQIAAIPESNRPLVTRCIQALTRICREAGCAIVMIGHNNRDGDFSGSTAWENRVRSRIHMKRDKDEDGSETIKLCRPKANYAAREDGVALEWHNGAYRCTDHRFETYGDRLDREMRERQIDQAFLDGLDKLTERRLATSPHKQAGSYAPKVMVQNGVANGFTEHELELAMRRLFKDDRIVADAQLWQKPNRHFASGLARRS